jgi:site-specific recombinase XerD
VSSSASEGFEPAVAGFSRWLSLARKSPNTVRIYAAAARKLAVWLAGRGVTDWFDVNAEHVGDFINSVLETRTASYASLVFCAVQQFFTWWAAERERPNPMRGLTAPHVPEQTASILGENQLRALIRSCQGDGLYQRRDLAIISMFIDCGLRRSELVGLTVNAIDLEHQQVRVLGAGRDRVVPFGTRTALALGRYFIGRASHRKAHLPALWLAGTGNGALTGSGVFQMIQRRGEALGIERLHPQTLRNSWAHRMRATGMPEEDLKILAGWASSSVNPDPARTRRHSQASGAGAGAIPGTGSNLAPAGQRVRVQ